MVTFPDGRDIAMVGIQACFWLNPDTERGLQLFDVTDPANPAQIGFLDTGGFARGVHEFTAVVRPDGVFALLTVPFSQDRDIAGRGDLRIADVSDPANPVEVADFHFERDAGLPGNNEGFLAVRNRAPELSRDRVRTPMPWASGPGIGFTSGARTWLPVGPRLDRDMVAVQRADPDSMACRVRDLLRARRELAAQADGPIEWLRTGPVIAYRRGAVVVVMNGGTDPVTLPPQGGRTTVFSTDSAHRDHNGTRGAALTVQPNAAIIFRTQHASAPVVWP